ncbi:MAG: hypothetical protein DRP55_01595 [Spirochaetes bacterium]|nr:MAG: hypothetical protein DRP55_01595 [Spirochaetota bacterium]RKY27096.1 MAG: hypothetical protein DRP61_04825 [Candidatus Omnitrophota bacterium]
MQNDIVITPDTFEMKFGVPKYMRNIFLATLQRRTRIPEKFSYSKMKTVYFDDNTNSNYFDSRDGQLYRRKYRFREYINPETSGAYYSLEIKIRFDKKTNKIKKLIYKRLPKGYKIVTFKKLINDFEKVLNCPLSFFKKELPVNELFPDTMICYERFRFDDYYQDARYNLDINIVTLPCGRLGTLDNGIYFDYDVFEIKSRKPLFLPSFLKGLDIEPLSVSKFIGAKELLLF